MTAVRPNYSRLASTLTVSNPTSSNAGGGTLCAGWNVAQTQVAFPINPGDYNLAKVALANTPSSVYEIECFGDPKTGTPASLQTSIANVPSLDHCVDRCNIAGSVTCQSVIYRKDTSACEIYNQQRTLTPNPMYYNGQGARLITPANPLVISGQYLLSANLAYNLGLCQGPTSTNYDKSFITVYNQTNTLRNAPGNRQDTFRVDCRGNTFFSPSSTPQTRQDHIAIAARFGLTPSGPDDCARLCLWHNVWSNDGNPTSTINCRIWHWTTTGVCEMYSDRPGLSNTPNNNATVLVAGYSRSSTGSEYAASAVNAYKRSLDPYEGEDQRSSKRGKRGKRGKKSRNLLPVPVVDPDPGSMEPHVIIPFTRH